jgi:gliding motility-associated-like protein
VNLEGDYDVLVTNTITGCTGTASLTVSSNTVLPTVMISVPSVTINCANLTASLNITSTPTTDVTYSWIAPITGSLDFYTISNPIASGSGIFTVVATNTISGCNSSSVTQNTVEVISDLEVPTTTLSVSSLSITCSNSTPSVNISTSISSATYSWSPANGIVAGTETTANPSFSLAGIYNVVVTNTISSCETFIDNNTVTVDLDNTIPVISISSSVNDGTITCLTSSISVTPTISPNNDLTYLWTSNGSGISGPTDQASATFTAAGTYTLAITNTITGCSSVLDASSAFNVYVDTVLPTLIISAPSVTTTCSNPTASLSITSTPTIDVIYSWMAPLTGSLDSYTISNPIASGSGIFTVVVTNTVSGCSSSSMTQNTIDVVPDNGIPTTTLSNTSLSITCANPTPSVNIGANTSSATYSWSPINGIVAGTETTANPSFNLAGSYSVVVTNTISGCETFINNNIVTVNLDNTIPVISISSSVNDGTLTCSTTSISVTPTISPNNDLMYLWTSNGSGISGPADQASATFTAAGIYTLAITNTVTGCSSVLDASSNFTVFVDVTSPISNFNFATSCSNDSVRFTDHSSVSSGSITNWNWNFGDTKTSILQNSANAYSTINSYTVILQVQSSNGCVNASSQVVNLSETVIADYISHGGSYHVNQGVSFINQSLGAINYEWNFGDGSSTDLTTNPSHIFTSLGIYTATLIATNGIGCVDTVAYMFEIKPSGYAIPGGFTPNNDGVNDGFSVLGGPFSKYELKVFNAWGNEVFFSNSQAEKWDGTYKDAQQPAGTYIYIFNGKIADGEELKLKGEVHIIR